MIAHYIAHFSLFILLSNTHTQTHTWPDLTIVGDPFLLKPHTNLGVRKRECEGRSEGVRRGRPRASSNSPNQGGKDEMKTEGELCKWLTQASQEYLYLLI